MRVLYLTNYPAPYRVDFFNELGKYCDLTVTFEETPEMQTHRDASWFHTNYEHFRPVFLKNTIQKNGHCFVSLQILQEIKKKYDRVIVGVYYTKTSMLAIEYMRMHRMAYWIETDGGMAKSGQGIQEKIKHHLISGATGYFSPSKAADDYLAFYGAQREKIVRYPFTSLSAGDLLREPVLAEQKKALRKQLGISDSPMVIGVGQFIHRKGWDVLIRCAKDIQGEIYIIGDQAPQAYYDLCKEWNAQNVHFVPFMKKEQIYTWYKASDVYAMPTREDIWGLVINEAMSFGLPVVTTTNCNAGNEMVASGENGYLIPVEDEKALVKAVNECLQKAEIMGQEALKTAQNYTIEKMAEAHKKALGEIG